MERTRSTGWSWVSLGVGKDVASPKDIKENIVKFNAEQVWDIYQSLTDKSQLEMALIVQSTDGLIWLTEPWNRPEFDIYTQDGYLVVEVV